MKLYRYIVRHDTGYAPNPFHGYCTLATCKPIIRRMAEVGDWIMGLGSKATDLDGYLVFAMQVAETLTFDEYWSDRRFEMKKPQHSEDYLRTCGDNVYRRDELARGWIQLPCFHCEDDDIARDTGTNRVLVASKYIYFGSNAREVPIEFLAWGDEFFVGFRNHRVNDLSVYRVDKLIEWIASLCRDGGCKGSPAERRRLPVSGYPAPHSVGSD